MSVHPLFIYSPDLIAATLSQAPTDAVVYRSNCRHYRRRTIQCRRYFRCPWRSMDSSPYLIKGIDLCVNWHQTMAWFLPKTALHPRATLPPVLNLSFWSGFLCYRRSAKRSKTLCSLPGKWQPFRRSQVLRCWVSRSSLLSHNTPMPPMWQSCWYRYNSFQPLCLLLTFHPSDWQDTLFGGD